MPNSPRRDIQAQLLHLRQGFAEALPEKMAEMEDAWTKLSQGAGKEENKLFHRLAHSMAGNAGTFGFIALGETARTLENAVVDEKGMDALAKAMDDFRKSASRAIQHSIQRASSPDLPVFQDYPQAPLVLLVEDEDIFARELRSQLEGYGYRVVHCEALAEVPSLLDQEMPAALIMGIEYSGGDLAGPRFLEGLMGQGKSIPPTLFVSVRDDLSARLESVRAGGLGYFTKPLEMPQLLNRLEVLVGYRGPAPFRIIMVEDSSTESAHYAHVLRLAGMDVTVVSDPMQVMEPLVTGSPDLILMDVYMPGCSGLELATVIRQQDAFMGIPIVFLSSESDTERQMGGMLSGGDDFLEKPISPEHLVAALSARVTRARLLRANMNRDSLTGLLNYANFKYQLKLELSRTARRQGRLALVVLDLDQFKLINDTYGHSVGDRVIRSLARHLQVNLRETDILGRFGGDVFGAILLDTDEEGALARLDTIRDSFASLHYRGLEPLSAERPFVMTFSCGLASFPGAANVGADSEALLQVADQALLEAKRLGRNRIITAERGLNA